MYDSYEIITTAAALDEVLDEIGAGIAALDFETTAFDPVAGRIRSVQLCNNDVLCFVDFYEIGRDLQLTDYKEGFRAVAHWFEEAAWVVFHNKFELKWFYDADAYPTCWDVGHLQRSIKGGGHMKLAQLVKWVCGHEMDKTEQASNWDNEPLTDDQIEYAVDDAYWTWVAWVRLKQEADEGRMRCFNMLDGMTDGVMEMEETGLLLDIDRHQKLVNRWQEMNDEREEKLRELITVDEVANLNSRPQLNDYFSALLPEKLLDRWPKTEKTGLLSTTNKDMQNMAVIFEGTPIADALRLLAERGTLQKYLSSFGNNLITIAKLNRGMIRARYNIAAAITCRFSSSGPNLQQQPRDHDFFGERLSVRMSFIAHAGCSLISLDYSGIELLVLALLSGDEQLLYDCIHGDVHAEVGAFIAGRPIDPHASTEDKDIRQSAKPVSFGIIYGTTALGLAGRTGWTYNRAQSLIGAWANRYPKAFGLRNAMMAEARKTEQIRMVDGGTIWMGKDPSMTKCANYPVQRAALSVMAHAIIRHKASMDELRDQYPNDFAAMASTIHDALIDEAHTGIAPLVLKTMKRDMEAGYRDVFPDAPPTHPTLLEGGIGPSWGELEEVEL